MKALKQVGEVYFHMRDLQKAESYFARMRKMATKERDLQAKVIAMDRLSNIMNLQGRHHESLELAEEAYEISTPLDSSLRLELLLNQAITLQKMDRYEEALQHLMESIRHFEALGDSMKLAIVYNNIGELYRSKLDDYRLARLHFDKAIAINKAIGNDYYLSMNYNNLGSLLSGDEEGNTDSAIHYLQKSLHLKQKIKDLGGEAIASYNLGKAYLDKGEHGLAKAHFDTTMSISRKLNIVPGLYYASEGLAEVAKAQGDRKQELAMLNMGYEISRQLDQHDITLTVSKNLYDYHKRIGNYAQAITYLEEVNTMLDSLYLNNKKESYGQVQARYEKELREAENALLKARQEEDQALLQAHQKQRQLWILGAIAAGMILVLLCLGYLQRNRLLRKEKDTLAELEKQYLALEEHEASLKELNAVKNKIFSVLGHDLRAPLNTISAFIDLLQNTELPPDEYQTLLSHLRSETHHSLKTLENILAWSRLQMDQKSALNEQVDLSMLLHEIYYLFKPIAENKKVALHTGIEEKITITGSEFQLRSIVTNLMSNAIKFTAAEKSVKLSLSKEDEFIVIRVIDEGKGMSPEVIERYEKGEINKSSYGTDGESGTGLGLHIVKEFVEQHRGSLHFLPNLPQGTVAELRLELK